MFTGSSSAAYGSVPTKDGFGAVDDAYKGAKDYVATNAPAVVEAAKKKLAAAQTYYEEGHWSWNFAGLIAGFAVAFVNIGDLVKNLTNLSPVSFILNIYLIFFAMVAVILEYKKLLVPAKYIKMIQKEALFLTLPYGRAGFYVFVGSVQLMMDGALGFLAGCYTLAVGVIVFIVSMRSYSLLKALKADKYTEEDIKKKFKEADIDNTGELDKNELAELCDSLGHKLKRNELDSALMTLDTNHNGRVSLEEFLAWWGGHEDESFFE